ncbi:TPA: hypothetical protein N0F65_000094 [Lagenidium giganteum]|uniref:BTB domain-containing protein n=1 Tax=Lagenidium giganteum TaxID=4803 RepID=A0AAV2YN82_9STRA|nr:TPA: hypothetical protein N0F65_000094 [Lagenidium giganteum]
MVSENRSKGCSRPLSVAAHSCCVPALMSELCSAARAWVTVPCENPSAAPCHRSLHASAVRKDSIYVFGGYDGSNRVNDFYEFNFSRRHWSVVLAMGVPPSPRDRHVAVVYKDSFYIFAGFDGSSRVNDFIEYNFLTQKWSAVVVNAGMPPTPRHSHAAVVYDKSMYCFGGYDGSYRNDFHEFNFGKDPDDRGFQSGTWTLVAATGRVPRPRYRSSLVVHKHSCILFGGHDGSRHLNDVHVFNFSLRSWSSLVADGPAPVARDSHVAVIHANSMYIFGGSTGSAMNDFYELNLDTNSWQVLQFNGSPPKERFCHVGNVFDSSLIIFGGYDGSCRLNDFKQFRFGEEEVVELEIPESTLIADLRSLVNSELMSDITFIVEGVPIYGHKILCMRCSYFRAMLTGEMLESRAREIVVEDVRRAIFLSFLEYLYSDHIDVSTDVAMELFVAADRYGVDRLKRICERKMMNSLCIENAASILHAADLHNATVLRDQCIAFMLNNFDAVTKTHSFEEMGRTNVELVFELLKRQPMTREALKEASDGLFLAAEHGRSDVLRALIEHGKGALDLSLVVDPVTAKTPLHVAVMCHKADAVRVLLAAGFPPEKEMNDNGPPSSGNRRTHQAGETQKRPRRTAYALAQSMHAQDLVAVFHQFMVQQVAIDNVQSVQKLVEGGMGIAMTDGPPHENTLLHWAASCGAHNTLGFLLGNDDVRQANLIDRVNADGATPLHDACRGNYVECVRLLLLHRASTTVKGHRGFSKEKTPLECATTATVRELFSVQPTQSMASSAAAMTDDSESASSDPDRETRRPSTPTQDSIINKYELMLEEKDLLIAQLKKTIEILATETHQINQTGEDKCVLDFIRKVRGEKAIVERQLEDAEDFIRIQQEQIKELKDQMRRTNRIMEDLKRQLARSGGCEPEESQLTQSDGETAESSTVDAAETNQERETSYRTTIQLARLDDRSFAITRMKERVPYRSERMTSKKLHHQDGWSVWEGFWPFDGKEKRIGDHEEIVMTV